MRPEKHIGWPRKGLADVSFCGRIKLHMHNPDRQEKQSATIENDQLVLVVNSEFLLPEDAPIRMNSAQFEELDYRKLHEAYSSKGRKSVTDLQVLFKVMAYGYQCGIYSSSKNVRIAVNSEYIISDRGIQLQMNQSIQVEGAFGLIKNDIGFRRFLMTGKKAGNALF